MSLSLLISAFGEYIKAEVLGDEILFEENVSGAELMFDDIESSLLLVKS